VRVLALPAVDCAVRRSACGHVPSLLTAQYTRRAVLWLLLGGARDVVRGASAACGTRKQSPSHRMFYMVKSNPVGGSSKE
jgi:hypothetical protein